MSQVKIDEDLPGNLTADLGSFDNSDFINEWLHRPYNDVPLFDIVPDYSDCVVHGAIFEIFYYDEYVEEVSNISLTELVRYIREDYENPSQVRIRSIFVGFNGGFNDVVSCCTK